MSQIADTGTSFRYVRSYMSLFGGVKKTLSTVLRPLRLTGPAASVRKDLPCDQVSSARSAVSIGTASLAIRLRGTDARRP